MLSLGVILPSFRVDNPPFANTTDYPDMSVIYWLTAAAVMLDTGVWDLPNPAMPNMTSSVTGSVMNVTSVDVTQGRSLAVGQTLFGNSTFPPGVQIASLGTGTGGTGTYNLNSTAADGKAATAAAVVPPTTMVDMGAEMFAAHNLSLEKMADDDAASGSPAGINRGPVSSGSMGSVSVSYDTSAGIELKAGHWNLTTYGTRFVRMARLRGMIPRQLNVGIAPPFTIGGWAGPPPWPLPGDSGFG